MHVRQIVQHVSQLQDGPVRADFQAQHFAQHGNADLKPHSGKEADQDGLREEVSQKAQLEQPRGQQQHGRQQRDQAGQLHIPSAAQRRHADESAGENCRSGGVGGNHQVTRRAKRGEGQRRQQQGIESRDDRRAGDLGVAQRLRDVHRRKLKAGQGIAKSPRSAQRAQALKQIPRAPDRRVVAHFFAPELSGVSVCPNPSSSLRSLSRMLFISATAASRRSFS